MSARRYATGWFVLVAVPLLTWSMPALDPLKARAFAMAVPEAVYLANLREPQFGCQNLAWRRAEVIVIGDSHSYAGWDFARIERTLGQRVGACAIGGLYAESVPALVDYVLRSSGDVKVLLLGYSPRMFWDSSTKPQQMAYHRQLIERLTPRGTVFLGHLILRRPLPHDGEAAGIVRHRERIEALAEGDVEARLSESRSSLSSLRDWASRLSESRHIADGESPARDVCNRIRASGARLWVVHIPESPFLERQYPNELWRAYTTSINRLASCADHVLADRAGSYGLGNRHYVNRSLRDDVDYAVWSRPGPVSADGAFDADHLNPVGAAVFTRAALARLTVR